MSNVQSTLTATEAIIGDETKIEALDADGLWQEIPGASGVSGKNGERPVTQVSTFKGKRARSGELPIGTVTVTLASFQPWMPIMDEIYDNWVAKTRMRWQWTTPDSQYFKSDTNVNTATIAIAQDTGVVSFGNGITADELEFMGSDQIPEGSVIAPDGGQKRYVIVSKTKNAQGVLTGFLAVDGDTKNAPTAQVAATQFAIVTPRVRVGPILCEITNTHDWETGVDQTGASSQVMLTPLALTPKPKVIA